MTEEIELNQKFGIDSLVRQIAQRRYPPVFVVEEDTEAARLVQEMEERSLPEQQRIEMAESAGIPVLNGHDVVRHLSSEIHTQELEVLRWQVLAILGAAMGMVVIEEDNNPIRYEIKERSDEYPLALKLVPVEELTEEDVGTFMFDVGLETLTGEWPVAFVVPPSELVRTFIDEQGRFGQSL